VADGVTHIPQASRPYSPGEVFMPTCPIQRCAASCEPDALYCSECGARLYTIESGRYGKQP
jgi:hypothetical protein